MLSAPEWIREFRVPDPIGGNPSDHIPLDEELLGKTLYSHCNTILQADS
jgi:hypothetical protein